jgi:hypothetical protein
MAEDKKPPVIDEQTVQAMQKLNSNPVMRVKEYIDGDGKLTNKEVEIYPRPSSSIEFSVDSKGQVKPNVKVYHEDPNQALDVAVDLLEKAMKVASSFSRNS